MPVCRSRTQSFQENRPFVFQILKLLVSLIGRFVACSARISVDTHRQTVTLAAHARRGLIKVQTLGELRLRYVFSRGLPLVARGE